MLKRLMDPKIWTRPVDYSQWGKKRLIQRIQELEAMQGGAAAFSDTGTGSAPDQLKTSIVAPAPKKFDFSKYNTRFIALKFQYLGWNYNGLALQNHETKLPTVEETIINALHKCRMVPSKEPKDFDFSRCGRTDKGVSAMNQVIALRVRSNLDPEEQKKPENDDKEMNYAHILNKLLPSDIRINGVCLRPPEGFDARFSCKYRHYKYFFHKSAKLDLELLQSGASRYVGTHDFRNFCKIDGSKQIKNFSRTILHSTISEFNKDFYVFDLKGSAFLWHQVRCMVAVLFLVGAKLEPASVIDDLFDVSKYPGRPLYEMAYDIPLVLYDCHFEDIEWQPVKQDSTVYETWLDYGLRGCVNDLMNRPEEVGEEKDRVYVNLGGGKVKYVKEYVPLSKRQCQDPAEEKNARYKKRKIGGKPVEAQSAS